MTWSTLATPLDEKFLDVAIREAEAQVPADRDDDHLGWEPEAGEGRAWNRSRSRLASSHAISLAELARSQRMQQRPINPPANRYESAVFNF